MHRSLAFIFILVAALSLAACSTQSAATDVPAAPTAQPLPSSTATPLPPTPTPTWTPLPPTPTSTATSLPPTQTPSATATELPAVPTSTQTQPQDSASASQSIRISNYRFGPNELEVKVGTQVTWTNQDEYNHTVTSDDGLFDSGALGVNDSFSFTFTEAGTFDYHCGFHGGMTGTIKVTP